MLAERVSARRGPEHTFTTLHRHPSSTSITESHRLLTAATSKMALTMRSSSLVKASRGRLTVCAATPVPKQVRTCKLGKQQRGKSIGWGGFVFLETCGDSSPVLRPPAVQGREARWRSRACQG